MKNRFLNIVDMNKQPISESDRLVIDVEKIKSIGKLNNNLGKECEESKSTHIVIQLQSCYPNLEVSYSMSFLPSNKVVNLKDATFLEYLGGISVNETKLEAIPTDFSKPMPVGIKSLSGKDIMTNSEFFIEKDQINFDGFKPGFITEELKNRINGLVVEVKNHNYLLEVSYKMMLEQNKFLTVKESHKISDEEYNSYLEEDKKWASEDFVEKSFPFQNHGEYLLKMLIKNWK